MEPGEALGIAAQIAVALAGFAGVVVVFRRESVHEWSPIDKVRLRLLLANPILPLGLCMMGLLLLTIKPMPPAVWRWWSAIEFVVFLLFVVIMNRTFRRLGVRKVQREGGSRFMLYLFGAFGGGIHALASVQPCLARRVLAVFRRDCLPTCHCYGPVCPHDSPAARIKPQRLQRGRKFTPPVRSREGDRNPR
jgi:hypothetical protein